MFVAKLDIKCRYLSNLKYLGQFTVTDHFYAIIVIYAKNWSSEMS